MPDRDPELLVERVLSTVELIPPGRVMSYGGIARVVGSCGPRQVGRVLAVDGAVVTWWRVVRADGTLPAALAARAYDHWCQEHTPLRADLDRPRVDMARAEWTPVAAR